MIYWAFSLPQEKKRSDKNQHTVGARRIRNKGPGGADNRVWNWPRVARGIGAGWEAPFFLFFVLEKHVFAGGSVRNLETF